MTNLNDTFDLVYEVHIVTNTIGEYTVLGFPLKVVSIFQDLVCLVHKVPFLLRKLWFPF